MRLAGATADHETYAKVWQCATCAARAAPKALRQASAYDRPPHFGHTVAVDIKEVVDADGTRFPALNVIGICTRFSVFRLLTDKRAITAANAFYDFWVAWAGVPNNLLFDRGGENTGSFSSLAQRLGVKVRVVPTESPWQQGIVERHGGILGDIVTATVYENTLKGHEELQLACSFAALAKNRRPDKTGYSARQRVFGCAESLPGSVIDSALDAMATTTGSSSRTRATTRR